MKVSKYYHSLMKKRIVHKIMAEQYRKIKQENRQQIIKSVKLTEEQSEKVNSLFTVEFGHEILLDWHRYYTAVSGKFDERYIPEDLYRLIEYFGNNTEFAHVFSNKIIQHRLLSCIDDIYLPDLLFYTQNGEIIDKGCNIISRQKAIEIIMGKEEVFAKPWTDSNSGIGCIKLSVDASNPKIIDEIEKTLQQCKDNYVFQSVLHNCTSIDRIYSKSVNTFRIMTYSHNGNIFHCPILLRIGRGGSFVDNSHAGGIFISVSDDGYLGEFAHTEFGESFSRHPDTNLIFKNYRIEGVESILNVIKRAHLAFLPLKILSWDVMVNDEGKVFVIEVNTFGQSPWLVQMANGTGMFGDNTGTVLRWLAQQMK